MNNYKIISPTLRRSFGERLAELELLVGDWLDVEKLEGRTLRLCRVFLSDAQNQETELEASDLYRNILSAVPCSIVEQAPLDGSKISILLMTSDCEESFLFHSLRLTPEECEGKDSYAQTAALFGKYLDIIRKDGLDMKTHLVRTWIYVSAIDVNYAGVVKARNDVFALEGLTADTHFIASTGIGGATSCRPSCVAIDFITYPDIRETDKQYLQALDRKSVV